MTAWALLVAIGLGLAAGSTGPRPTIETQAFYIIFDNQIENSSFPAQVCQNNGLGPQGGECVYDMGEEFKSGVVITQPMNITKWHTKRIHTAIPGSIVLAYWCFDSIPIYTKSCSTGHIMGDKPNRNCSTTYAW
jgi:hypothetical protein